MSQRKFLLLTNYSFQKLSILKFHEGGAKDLYLKIFKYSSNRYSWFFVIQGYSVSQELFRLMAPPRILLDIDEPCYEYFLNFSNKHVGIYYGLNMF